MKIKIFLLKKNKKIGLDEIALNNLGNIEFLSSTQVFTKNMEGKY
jgi:hypothetical protein